MDDSRALFAVFERSEAALHAVETLRGVGHARLEVFGPHADPELARALAPRPSRLPVLAGSVGLCAAAGGYALVQWTAYAYPVNVSGFGLLKFWPYVPLTFISGILATGVTAAVGFLLRERLPRLHATAQEERCLAAVGRGRWVLRLDLDPQAEVDAIGALVEAHAPDWLRVVEVEP